MPHPISVMKKCGFDPLLWEVVTCRLISGSWDVTIKNADGEGVLHTNRKYSVTHKLGGKLTRPNYRCTNTTRQGSTLSKYDAGPICLNYNGFPFETFVG